ncbi:sugar ABC transporter substrate-binding protein [Rhizobiaceae sp. 2RAB30]
MTTLAAFAALAALPLAGGGSLAEGLSGKLDFMVAEYSAKTAPFWRAQVDNFKTANPGVEVNLEVVNWQQMHDTTAQRIAAGAMPDLVNTATIWLPEWVKAGAIKEVSGDYVSDAVKSDIVPSLFQLGASYEGKSWGLPIAVGGRGLFYNSELMTKAGYDKAPGDWTGLKEAVATVHEKTGQFGFGYDAKGVQAFRYFGFFLWNNGGDFFDADGKAAFNSDKGVEALKFLVDLAGTGAIPAPAGTAIEDLEPMFKGGRLAMLIDGNYFATAIRTDAANLKFNVAAVPTSEASVAPVAWGVTDTLVIGNNADPAITKAFIDHIYSTAARTEFDVNEGLLPLLKSQASLPEFTKDPVTAAFVAQLPSFRFDPLHPNYTQMQELVKTAMQKALTGTDPKAALDEAAEAFNALTAE